MKPPWEENWVPHPDLNAVCLEDGRAVGDFDRVLWDDEPGARAARAKLAAAAPAMWRLLIRFSLEAEGDHGYCFDCGGKVAHLEDCDWHRIAKEVGYR